MGTYRGFFVSAVVGVDLAPLADLVAALEPAPPRILFATASNGNPLSVATVRLFEDAGIDTLVLQYAGEEEFPFPVRVIRDAGGKYQLARKHLAPADVAGYDFIFLWDDDIDAAGFDPHEFIRLMQVHDLAAAQPALTPESFFTHEVTLRVAEGEWHDTDIVEIMVPVYRKDAWLEMYPKLRADNVSGWGYDLLPTAGRLGIIDRFPVTHTRPVVSGSKSAFVERAATLAEHRG
jgi:hypothetical protein